MRAGWGERYSSRMANETARKLRRATTRQEARLWLHLRDLRKQGYHFRRQVPIDGYIVDFACYHPKLVIEIDGGQHGAPNAAAQDSLRDIHPAASGFKVLRFWNCDVDRNLNGVMEVVLAALDPPPRRR